MLSIGLIVFRRIATVGIGIPQAYATLNLQKIPKRSIWMEVSGTTSRHICSSHEKYDCCQRDVEDRLERLQEC